MNAALDHFQMMQVNRIKERAVRAGEEGWQNLLMITLNITIVMKPETEHTNISAVRTLSCELLAFCLPRVFTHHRNSGVYSPTQLQADCRHNTYMPFFLFLVSLILHSPTFTQYVACYTRNNKILDIFWTYPKGKIWLQPGVPSVCLQTSRTLAASCHWLSEEMVQGDWRGFEGLLWCNCVGSTSWCSWEGHPQSHTLYNRLHKLLCGECRNHQDCTVFLQQQTLDYPWYTLKALLKKKKGLKVRRQRGADECAEGEKREKETTGRS